MKDPVLREMRDEHRKVQAIGGLHQLPGNKSPYFSLTMNSWRVGRNGRLVEDTFGAAHGELLKLWPELAPLAALHLSDMNGEPMHAEENGWYFLVGAMPMVANHVQYHGSNSRGHYGGEYREPTPEESLEVFARLWRLPIDEAREVRDTVLMRYLNTSKYKRIWEGGGIAEAKERLHQWAEHLRPRWKAQADDAIKTLGLVVYP